MMPSQPIYSPQPLPLTTTQHRPNRVDPTAGFGPPSQRTPGANGVAARTPRGAAPNQPNYTPATTNSRSPNRIHSPSEFVTAPRSLPADPSLSTSQQPAGLPKSGVMPASFDQPTNSRNFSSPPMPQRPSGMRSAQNAPPTRSSMMPSANVTMPGTDSPPSVWSQSTPWQAPTWSAPPQPQR
jgi:hypothetical protein